MFQKLRICVVFLLFCIIQPVHSQYTFPVNGPFDDREGLYVLSNARITTAPGKVIENGVIVIRQGKIEAIGSGVRVPENGLHIDLGGASIYPSFIDLYSDYGIQSPETSPGNRRDGPQFLSETKGAYGWNQAIKPETHANEIFHRNKKDAETYRKAGFGSVLSHHMDGIARGTGALVYLSDKTDNEVFIRDKASAHYSFDKGSSTQDYPGSLMGAIALVRQTYYDAEWYKNGGHQKEYNISLDHWNRLKELPAIFEVNDWLTLLRAVKIANEFNTTYIIKGAGDEYQRIEDVKATGSPLIIPLNFPDAYDVSDPFDALNVSLVDMMHWEMAPANPAFLEKHGIRFALTASGLEKKGDLLKHVRKAIEHGLSKEKALEALTKTPAQLLGVEDKIGTLETGKVANFLITSGDLFAENTVIYQNWIDGKPFFITDFDFNDIRGNYNLSLNDGRAFELEVGGVAHNPRLKLTVDTVEVDVQWNRKNHLVSLMFKDTVTESEGATRLSGVLTDTGMRGSGEDNNGNRISWTANITAPFEPEEKEVEEEKPIVLPVIPQPFVGYGYTERPEQNTYFIQNATLWTNETAGILENASLLIRDGKIAAVGENLTPPEGAIIINAEGKHVTSGIIDEHSHIAISRGVNEWTQSSTAEVRIGDVINSEDINIFRQLGGGVTMAQLLHGSANAIGGQAQLIKMRWGFSPEEMKVDYAPGYIKFALGENVKQSNWGERNTERYPQTRMGVEQVYYNYFTRAKEYAEEFAAYEALNRRQRANAIPPRRDLMLDALQEILDEKRFITCHSYVQSEINMLMHAAEDLGFRVKIFTHILEGYKVADKMKAHGAGGSSFADWWMFKYEVIDAIAYNAAIMQHVGVTTAINSDDAEMGRRLNQEAAKAVKYGGVPEEEAWKMVTLNPAKLLQVDDRVGSLKAGKDADVVIWSHNPLSIYAVAEKTFIDGRLMYDREEMDELTAQANAERHRLINLKLQAKEKGHRVKRPTRQHQHIYHCDDIHDYRFEHHLHDHEHGHGHDY